MTISASPVHQAIGTANAATTAVVTITAAAAGNCLVACIEANNFTVSSVSGGGVTWARLKKGTDAHFFVDIWYGLNSSGVGTSVTVTFGGSVTGAVNVSEWSGIKTSAAADSVSNTGNGNDTAPTTGSVTPTAGPALIIGAVGCTQAITAGPSGGFSALTEAIQGSNRVDSAYLVQTSPGAATAGWTFGSANGWDTAIGVLLGDPPADTGPAFMHGGFF